MIIFLNSDPIFTGFLPYRPIIDQTYLSSVQVVFGQNVTWKCLAVSHLQTFTQWFKLNVSKDGEILGKVRLETPIRNELTILNVSKPDLGQYQCIATNNFGSDTRTVSMEEDFKFHLPIIEKQKEKEKLRWIIAFGAGIVFSIAILIYAMVNRSKMKKKRVTIIQAKQSFVIRKKVIIEQHGSDKSHLTPNIKIEEERVHVDPQNREVSKVMNQYQFQLDPNWEIPRTCLDFDPEPIGEGAFGIVYKADAYGLVPNVDRLEVAVKMLKNGHTESDLRDLVTEMEVMKRVQGGHTHKNVINLLGCVTQDGRLLVLIK